MRARWNILGILIGGYNISNVRYTNYTVLIARSESELQEMIDKTTQESQNNGLSLNSKKTEITVISKKQISLQFNIIMHMMMTMIAFIFLKEGIK